MLLTRCSGCRQPLDEPSAECRYCSPARSKQYVGRHLPDRQVWCTTEQRYIAVGWVAAGQAFVCECTKVHEVIECGACGKAWGTVVNSFGELDRSGLRRCAACRIPNAEHVPAAVPECSRCGTSDQAPAGRVSRMLRRLRPRRGQALECMECQAPVGWWHPRRRGADVVAAAHPYEPEFTADPPRWNGHGDDDQFVSADQRTPGESAAA